MPKKKKLILLILFTMIVVCVGIAGSYALWSITLNQANENIVSTSCFDITFEEDTSTTIKLEKAFPISDEEGRTLTPYTFKIKNNCSSYAKYTLAIEITQSSTLDSGFLKYQLNNEKAKILNTNKTGTTTLKNTKEAYIIDDWYLYEQEEKEYNLRIWLDGSITKDTPNVQGSSWGGIVTINASYIEEAPKAPGVLRAVISGEKNGMWEYKKSITKIVIQNELKEIEGSIKTTDESSMSDGSVMSYVVPNEDGTTYTAYLQSNRKLYLNPNSSYLFYIFSKVIEIEGMEYLDTTNVTNMSHMFSGLSSLTSLDVSNFDTSKVTNMSWMFFGLSNLINLDVSNFDTSKVTNMSRMFSIMSNLTSLDVSRFNTSKVTDMSSMFLSLSNLTSLDVSNFDTRNVTDMSYMFYGLSNLTSLDVSNFNTSNVTDMSSMFSRMSSLTSLDLSNFDTSKVTNMSRMFSIMSNLTSLDVSNFWIGYNKLDRKNKDMIK